MGLRWWRPHQALSRAFEPQADAGWPPPLVSPVSFRRATQTYKAVRRAIQHSQASLRALAKRYGINPKTVAKWKKRGSVADLPTGPKDAASTVLSIEEEAVIVAFRRLFSPGICWSGLSLNCWGCEVHALQTNS